MDDTGRLFRWVGPLTDEQLENSESFGCERASLFIPSLGQCSLAATPRHSHPGYMFLVIQDLFEEFPGLPEASFTNSGDLMVIAVSPDIPHQEDASEDFIRYCALFVDPALVKEVWDHYAPEDMPVFAMETWKIGKEAFPLLKSFMAEYENGLPGAQDMMDIRVRRILHLFALSRSDIVVNTDRITARDEVARAIEHMHRRYADRISVGDLAEVSRMSESHFSRVFKEDTGETPAAMLARIRLEKARKMLRAGRRSVSEVAYACGFTSPAHFSTSFAAAFGNPPSTFKPGKH